jgi:DNA end-binding protein Ku
MFDKSYYLEPDSASNKAYVLLRRTLESTDKTAIVRMALRQKTRLAALRVYGDVLMVQTLLWSDEVREAKFPSLDEPVKISDKELDLSKQLVESLVSDFEPDQFVDEYQAELRTLIAAKLEQGDAVDTAATFGEQPEEEEGGEVIDLMEALRQSIASKRGGSDAAKGGGGTKGGGGKAASASSGAPKASGGSKSSGASKTASSRSKAAASTGDGAKKKAPAAKKKAAS